MIWTPDFAQAHGTCAGITCYFLDQKSPPYLQKRAKQTKAMKDMSENVYYFIPSKI